jgi:AMP-polyphosphate phosphotransferase
MGISLSQFDAAPARQSLDRDGWQSLAKRLGEVQTQMRAAHLAAFILIEGWDEASRADALQALAAHWDPRFVRAWAQFPNDPKQHLLAPAWRTLPDPGEIALYEGGWYASVLDGRLSGRLSEHGWKRHYDEINEFEAQQIDHGVICLKFFLHQSGGKEELSTDLRSSITREEGLRAFEEQLDWTHTHWAPWTIINANQPQFAHAEMFETIVAAFERAAPMPVELVNQDS